MSTLKEFLVSLAGRGIQIYVDDGRLKTKSEPGAITADIAQTIRENKEALIGLLQSAAAPSQPALPVVQPADGPRGALSFAQQRIWFLDQFGKGSAHYNMPSALRLQGNLDRAALQATIDEIVRRHEILRTTYVKSSAGAVQQIAAPAGVPVAFVDLSGLDAAAQQVRIDGLMQREAATAFNLARDLMIRVTLAKTADDAHVLLLTLHHIAADGWSLGILVREFAALYGAFLGNGPSPLPELAIQYADYASWQRRVFSGASMDAHLQFWRQALDGVPRLHNLPLDRPRPVNLETAGRSHRCTVDAGLLARLKALGSRHDASLFMVLQAAFSLLLARWSGDEDIVVGTPVAGRERTETEGLIGCFINTLTLRSRCRPGMSFEQLLEQSRTVLLGAYAHQEIPFEMVVENLNPPRSMSHTPLFQVMFALQNYDMGALALPGLVVEQLPVDGQGIKFDIAVMATEADGALQLLWTYVDGLFDPATIDSMAARYLALLASIAQDPAQDIHRLAWLDSAQAAALHALAAQAGHGQRIVDRHGAIQPVGAAGWVSGADAGGSRQIGRMRADGAVEVLGHDDADALVDGHRIATGAVESALLAGGHVQAAAAMVRRHGGAGVLVAYVVPHASSGDGWQDACRGALKGAVPDFMMPAVFTAVGVLPRLPDGSIDCRLLPEPDFSTAGKAAPVPPRHELEVLLCEIWCSLLSLESVGIHDNFFDAGGTSLHSVMVQQEILVRAGIDVAVTDLFTYPTIAGLARHLQDQGAGELSTQPVARRTEAGGAVAIIGMAGRFPDAGDIDAFWKNIAERKESLTVYSDDELRAAGVSQALLDHPGYVKSGVVLDRIQEFDAAYFGFTPREAEVMDPQQRLLFECAVEALEQGGYGDDRAPRCVGVYVGTGESQYLFEHLLPQSELLDTMRLAAMYGNRADYAATRLSYRLNLSGPSVNVGTACSTSLVAVHEACRSLLNGECEMALAGGSAIAQLGPRGYLYKEGGIASPDGHCRAFDRDAAGTRAGSGAALVLMKRLEDAIAAGDTIHAVIKGSAINNDGADKVGYTAPSVLGQAQVIAQAHAAAGVAAESIQYVEAHGTGTLLGDPIEMRALAKAFASAPQQSCALSAVKTNIGHLDSAAGIAGLVKAVKALSERKLPPIINFNEPNPQIDFRNGPFYVNTELQPWPAAASPRRAGVSSFGIGGTNAHVVLEEAPAIEPGEAAGTPQLVVLSAKTDTALTKLSSRLLDRLRDGEGPALQDIAYTLQAGRAAHGHRIAFVADSTADAAQALADAGRSRLLSSGEASEQPSIVFMFTGQGSQYAGMAAGLYRSEPVFRDVVDLCAARLEPELGLDLRRVMFAGSDDAQAAATLGRTDIAQPALFVLEYALARLLAARGVRPDAMIGHSLGEYVAACLAGVFALDDALQLVAARGRLMQAAQPGAMLSVALAEDDAHRAIEGSGCGLAAVNGPRDCVVSGPADAIDAIARAMEQQGVSCRPLRTSHAFHSPMMDGAAAAFGEVVRGVALSAPSIPYISNVSGTYVTPEEATDPGYWVRHLLGTVRFAQGVAALHADTVLLRRKRAFVEVGPGITLASLLRKNLGPAATGIACIRHAQDARDDAAVLLSATGQLWVHGADVDWRALHQGERRRRVPLPTYPFERQRYWIERTAAVSPMEASGKRHAIDEWFYAPVWAHEPARTAAAQDNDDSLWLVFADQGGFGEQLERQLAASGRDVVTVVRGSAFAQTGQASFAIDAAEECDYGRLLGALEPHRRTSVRIVHLWSIDALDGADAERRAEQAEQAGFGPLLSLARACDRAWRHADVQLDVVTRNVFSVTGEEAMAPEHALALGLCKVIPQEYPQIRVHHVDTGHSPDAAAPVLERAAQRLLAECSVGDRPLHVAHRGSKRWTLRYEQCQADEAAAPSIRQGGTYLLTGGLGRIGLRLAGLLAQRGAGAVVLVSRTPAPAREQLDALRAIEASGARVMFCCANVASYAQMRDVVEQAERAFGPLHGVIHGAGKVHDAVRPVEAIDGNDRREQFLPKVVGTLVLDRVLAGRQLDFCLLMSSLSSILGGLGFGAYAAANSFIDAYAQWKHHSGEPAWRAVNWDGWSFAQASAERYGMSADEGLAAFERVLGMAHLPQVVNSTGSLDARIAQWLHAAQQEAAPLKADHARPAMQTAYEAPRNAVEARVSGIWQELLGFDQVGVHDNFFELGGDSILITKVLGRIRACPGFEGLDLKLQHLFEMPTVAQLSAYIEEIGDRSALAAKSERLRASASVVQTGEI